MIAEDKSLNELMFRRNLCDEFIRIIMTLDDPRKESALEKYRQQLHELDARIAVLQKEERKRLGIPEPEPIVVQLKTAVITAKSDKGE